MALKGQLELENLTSDPASSVTTGQMYFNTSTNKVRVYNGTQWEDASSGGGGGCGVPTSGLEIHLDAADSNSYSGSGTTWTDLSGNNRHWNVSQSAFVSSGIKHFDFSGQYRATYSGGGGGSSLTDVPTYTNRTIIVFSTIRNASSDYQTLVRGLNAHHQVICWDNGYNLGTATNNWYDSSYDITSIPNYNTKFNGQFYRISTASSPYWAMSLNGSTSNQATLTNSAAGSDQGFCVIGQYHNNTVSASNTSNAQSWGKIHAFLYYSRHISFAEQATIYNYYKTALGI